MFLTDSRSDVPAKMILTKARVLSLADINRVGRDGNDDDEYLYQHDYDTTMQSFSRRDQPEEINPLVPSTQQRRSLRSTKPVRDQ